MIDEPNGTEYIIAALILFFVFTCLLTWLAPEISPICSKREIQGTVTRTWIEADRSSTYYIAVRNDNGGGIETIYVSVYEWAKFERGDTVSLSVTDCSGMVRISQILEDD